MWQTFFLALLPLSPVLVKAIVYSEDPNYPAGAYGPGPYQIFASSNATPPAWNYVLPINETILGQLEKGYIFHGPRGSSERQGSAAIFNQTGELIWSAFVDGYTQTMQFAVQTYKNESVLTMWQGDFNSNGYGNGSNLLLDSTYSVVGNISTSGLGSVGADLHEFQITAQDTALMSVYNATPYDLSQYSIDNGYILDNIVQEVEIATGIALFTWHSIDHVQPSQCYSGAGTTGTSDTSPWDYFHLNSIEKDGSGNYLISSRHCHAVYYIEGSTGNILWQLNGMNSSFAMGEGSTFQWQHDARFRNNSQISIFDNAGTSWDSSGPYARGLLIDLDMANMSASLVTGLIPQNETVSQSQGNMQLQPNGNWMVGWGQTPFFGEYTHDGAPLWGAQFGKGDVQSYRVFRNEWVGRPKTVPDLAIGNNTASMSWNGATEISTWQLHGSNDASANTSLANATKSGFETNVTLPSTVYAYYQASAHDISGGLLGYSKVVATNSSTSTGTGAASTSTSGAKGTLSIGAGSIMVIVSFVSVVCLH